MGAFHQAGEPPSCSSHDAPGHAQPEWGTFMTLAGSDGVLANEGGERDHAREQARVLEQGF